MSLELPHQFNILVNLCFSSYAKQLIEDTIRRNASPIRTDDGLVGGGGVVGADSCSSLTSSNSDDQLKLMRNITSATNISYTSKSRSASGANSLLHSLSTNDTSLGEYKFTVNVGSHSIKITGDNLDLVRVSLTSPVLVRSKIA